MTALVGSRGAADATRMRVPEFFIVGAPKCGTTSLYRMLRQHPRIFMPDLKEPRFLASDARGLLSTLPERANIAYPETLDDYLALLAEARQHQLAGAATQRSCAVCCATSACQTTFRSTCRRPMSRLRRCALGGSNGFCDR